MLGRWFYCMASPWNYYLMNILKKSQAREHRDNGMILD
jgi:hypothetical protein